MEPRTRQAAEEATGLTAARATEGEAAQSAGRSAVEPRRRLRTADWVGVAILVVLLVLGLTWSKWLPYWDKAWTLSRTAHWDGSPLFDTTGEAMSVSGAWEFTVVYFLAVWKALLVALLVAAAIDALVPRDWLLRVMNRRHATTQSLVGATLALPSMMCTCCAAPVAAGLRGSGVTRSAALAYWVGNPLLNPAVLIFLGLVLPWQYLGTRLGVGLLIVLGASALIGTWFAGRVPEAVPQAEVELRSMPQRYLRSLSKFALILVPEHLALVFVIGLIGPWLAGLYGLEAQLGAVAILLAACVGTLLVIPTGGEIPIILALLAAGAGAGTTGALLIALPALSIPSMVMVGKAMGWKATAAMGIAVMLGSVVAGLVVLALT